MVRTNDEKLVTLSVMGAVAHPFVSRRPYRVGANGAVFMVPGTGGITYDRRIGDPCVGLVGDHIEPGVSTQNGDKCEVLGVGYNLAYNALACVGNQAIVATGDAKGARGVVTGKHGGIEHVMIDFEPDVLEKMLIGDKILVKARGQGLELLDHPAVATRNLDPTLLTKMPVEARDGRLHVGVAKMVPGALMGSGLGADQVWTGDYDIQLFDAELTAEYGLDELRFGDFVAIRDTEHTYGRMYKQGAVSIGIIIHSASAVAGHGPGVTTLLTSGEREAIVPHLDAGANLAKVLGITG